MSSAGEMPELQPCPFCGEAKANTYWRSVSCEACGASGPNSAQDRRASIERWNTRADFTTLSERDKAVIEAANKARAAWSNDRNEEGKTLDWPAESAALVDAALLPDDWSPPK